MAEVLDYHCAKKGREICEAVSQHLKLKKETEAHLNKSIGILHEDGVYAFFLYQKATGKVNERGEPDKKKKASEGLIKKAIELLEVVGMAPKDSTDALNKILNLSKDLDKLLLSKRILERAMTYALYHAKTEEPGVKDA